MLPCAAFLTGFFPPLSIAAANGAAILLLVVAITAVVRGREKWTPGWTGFEPAIFCFITAWLISSTAGLFPMKSLSKALSQMRFLPFYLLIWCGGGRHRQTAFQGYLWGAGLLILWGLLQMPFNGWHNAGHFSSLFDVVGRKGAYYLTFHADRAHGPVHPLTYAELILPALFFATTHYLDAPNRTQLARRAVLLGAAGGALLLSQSRGPWLAAGVGMAALLLFHPRRLRLLAPLALVSVVLLMTPQLYTRVVAASGAIPDEGRSHRLILWNNAWEVAKRHWVTGVGAGNLAQAVEQHHEEPGFLPNPLGRAGDAHNQYLHHFTERGVLGLLALLLLLATPLLRACRQLRRPADAERPAWVAWGLVAAFLAFPVMNLTERVFDDGEPAMVFWLLASLLARTVNAPSSGSDDKR